ncbi:HK97 gp10 family phage protein [Actinomadura sp. K4S16]|uniref:HK97 gp10 family phage protein n=1 Tax=Actinomadura sp. K4S16 TaxID=1316147 RepID=UPI0011EE313D|nr:HK97 gp10 family phage protein [Actinomadura sp. K4S16]
MPYVRVTMTPGWQRLIRPALRRTENELAEAVARDARGLVGVDSGDLKRTIKARGNRVYVGTSYWHHHEYGTRPHLILPRHKQALYWPGARHPVARVHHPGTAPNPFLRTALRRRRNPRDRR